MAKKKEVGFDEKAFLSALDEISEEKHVDKEETLVIIKEAFAKAYSEMQKYGKSTDLPDPIFEVDFDDGVFSSFNSIHFYEVKIIQEDDLVVDDCIEIELSEALEIDPNAVVGGRIRFEVVDFIEKYMDNDIYIRKFVQNFRYKLKERSKRVLIETFSKKIGTLIIGEVERIEGKFVTLNFANGTGATLSARDITDRDREKLSPGDHIRVYLNGVIDKSNSPQLSISRTCDGFVAKIFEEEIYDVMNGTVKIEKISRIPGDKCKVAVSSLEENVDAVGSCIGPNSKRIQNITAQLSGEKVDVIKFSTVPEFFIAESLKPANVVGISIREGDNSQGRHYKEAVAVVKNEESNIAIGKKGSNVRLAAMITGYQITVMELDDAMEKRVPYVLIEDIKRKLGSVKVVAPEYEDEEEVYETEVEVVNENNEIQVEAITPKSEDIVKDEVVTKQTEKIEIKGKAKISLVALEKEIELGKKKQVTSSRRFKKDENPVIEETKSKPVVPVMDIYTAEELKALDEEEENKASDFGVDLDEYDSDDYYDAK